MIILHIFPRYKIGGAPINILRFIKGSNEFFKNYAIANNEDEQLYSDYTKHSVKAYDIDTTKLSIKSVKEVLNVVREIKPDIVHVNGKGGAFYGLFIKLFKFKQIRLVYTFRGFHLKFSGLKSFFYITFERVIAYFMNAGIAVSESERTFYLDTVKTNASKVLTIPNGIEVKPRELPLKIKKEHDKFKLNIVTLSRINHQKDLLTMLKAFERVGREDVALHIMGGYIDDPFEREFKIELDAFHKKMKQRNNVFFWGDVDFAANYIHNFNIYWSTALFEGLPTAIVEAMMSKVLVVGTDCRGNIDLIEDGITGYLTKKQDVKSNITKILKAIMNVETENSQHIIHNAYQRMDQFTIENNVRNISQLYKGLIN